MIKSYLIFKNKYLQNGEALRIADALDHPKGSGRVHSFSNKSSEQSNTKVMINGQYIGHGRIQGF